MQRQIWSEAGSKTYSSAESRAKIKPSVQVALIQRKGCEGCPKDSPVALPNELLQSFPVAGGQMVMGPGGQPGAECVHGALQRPFSAEVNAGESTHGDDSASNNKAWFFLLFSLMSTSASSKYSFPFSSYQSKRQ